MATFTKVLQGSVDTPIGATDVLQFAGGTFGSRIAITTFNSSTHVRNSGGTEISGSNTPNNVKYVASGTADWGDGTEALANMLASEATLKITFSHTSAVSVENAIAYFYDGTTPATAPVGLTCYMAEQGDATWTNAEGSGAALELADQESATDHDYYLALSVSPDSVGTKSGKARIELTYY